VFAEYQRVSVLDPNLVVGRPASGPTGA